MRAIRMAAGVLVIAWATLAGIAALAEAPEKQPSSKAEKKPGTPVAPAKESPAPSVPEGAAVSDEPGHVYTNDDLDRLPQDPAERRRAPVPAAPPAGKGAEKPASAPPDPLKQLEDDQARAAGLKAQIGAAEKRVAAAEARVRDLEKQALEIKNPYLPRPEIPPEQADAWKRMTNGERLKATEDEIASARKAVEDAKADLEKLRSAAGVH